MLDNSVTVSFTCSSNTALLLITLHDLLSIPVDDSIAVMDNFTWLVDEIADKIDGVLLHVGEDSDDVSELVRLMARYVRRRNQAIREMRDL